MHAVRSFFEQEVTEAILLVDASNAFNSLNRSSALHNIRCLCPSLATILINTYTGLLLSCSLMVMFYSPERALPKVTHWRCLFMPLLLFQSSVNYTPALWMLVKCGTLMMPLLLGRSGFCVSGGMLSPHSALNSAISLMPLRPGLLPKSTSGYCCHHCLCRCRSPSHLSR